MGAVWAAEALNTAVEFLADEVSLEHRERIGKAKDVAAFGVLATALAALAVGSLVFLPHFL
jgi:diacylglycerol kinase